jgi:hypothetical protein
MLSGTVMYKPDLAADVLHLDRQALVLRRLHPDVAPLVMGGIMLAVGLVMLCNAA